MSLANILEINDNYSRKDGISEERLTAILPQLRDAIAFWREYPDIFADFLCGDENPENFHLFFYQRVFLRQVMRHRYAYATYPRAFSKSFLSLLVLSLRCILYPGAALFVTTGGKEPNSSWLCVIVI